MAETLNEAERRELQAVMGQRLTARVLALGFSVYGVGALATDGVAAAVIGFGCAYLVSLAPAAPPERLRAKAAATVAELERPPHRRGAIRQSRKIRGAK